MQRKGRAHSLRRGLGFSKVHSSPLSLLLLLGGSVGLCFGGELLTASGSCPGPWSIGSHYTLSSPSKRKGAEPQRPHLLFFIWRCIQDKGDGDGSKGFCGHMSLVPSKPRSVIRVRGPGRLSVFKRCVSAFGRSQSLALHLPVVLFFL